MTAIAVEVGDEALALRVEEALAAAGFAVLGPEEADVIVADRLPGAGDAARTVVLARGAAARQALRAGARGLLPPSVDREALAAAVRAVALGLAVAAPELLDTGATEDGAAPLTAREVEVLALLADGASNKVVARRLGISFHTAKAHVAAILAKLGATSRADAVARGARLGVVML